MAREVAVRAAAKVNLHLQILGRRPDGYHELRSLFQAVSLYDDIILRSAGAPGSISIAGDFACRPEDNSIAFAVRLFRLAAGVRDGIEVEVIKRIPAAGGLGGGSSDAAAVLRGLSALFDDPIPGGRLRSLGREIGSDVPFFMSAAAAVVEGKGETVIPISGRTDFALVAANPGIGVSTKDAYRWVDESGASAARAPIPPAEIVERYRSPVEEWDFWNDFDAVIAGKFPEIRGLMERMEAAGRVRPRLTGSGSTIIGVFPDLRTAQSCADGLEGAAASVLLPLATIPALG